MVGLLLSLSPSPNQTLRPCTLTYCPGRFYGPLPYRKALDIDHYASKVASAYSRGYGF